MKIRKVLVTAANPRQRTLPLQTLIDPAGEPKSALQVVLEEAAGAGIECLDSPFPDVNDAEGLAQSCARVKALGMTGKCAKHASQVAGINAAFTPSAAELDRARRIVAAFEADPTRPLVFDGKLVELPTVKRLERLVGAHRS
jgi:citrate lyase beta subunit